MKEFNKLFESEIANLKSTIKKPNVMLLGKTGVGKSTLINTCFGFDKVESGVGEPITKNISRYEVEWSPIVIYDSIGYEADELKTGKFDSQIMSVLDKNNNDIKSHIHICWYCMSNPGSRITDFDIASIKKIKESGTPVMLCLTKSDLVSDEESENLKKTISMSLENVKIYELSSVTNGGMDLSRLIEDSISALPESLRYSFIAGQKASINEKRTEAKKIIKQHIITAFGSSYIPIPFANLPLLITNQTAMIVRITMLYGFSDVAIKYSALVEVALAGLLPKMIELTVSQLLKFIPVIGTIAGDLLNASVASGITYAIGTAVSETCAYFQEERFSSRYSEGLNVTASLFLEVFLNKLQGIKSV